MTNDLWRDAEVAFPDWIGGAQLDQRITGENASFERVVGLDPDEWMILGVEISWGEVEYGPHELHVVAARRVELGEVGGEIPVTDFLIHDADPIQVLRTISHVFKMRLRRSGYGERPLRRVERADVPEQPSSEI